MDTRTEVIPPVDELDRLPAQEFSGAIAPLFEGADRFVARLEAERPFGTPEELFERARAIAQRMPEEEQLKLVDAHPRLGAPPGSVSALSYVEQGYERDAAEAAAEDDRREIDERLARLNTAYEQRFGFRFCVFVAGRPRADLLPDFEKALTADRSSELRRAVSAAVDIAEDRYQRMRGGGTRPQ